MEDNDILDNAETHEEYLQKIQNMHDDYTENGMLPLDIAKKYNVKGHMVYNCIKKYGWKEERQNNGFHSRTNVLTKEKLLTDIQKQKVAENLLHKSDIRIVNNRKIKPPVTAQNIKKKRGIGTCITVSKADNIDTERDKKVIIDEVINKTDVLTSYQLVLRPILYQLQTEGAEVLSLVVKKLLKQLKNDEINLADASKILQTLKLDSDTLSTIAGIKEMAANVNNIQINNHENFKIETYVKLPEKAPPKTLPINNNNTEEYSDETC